MSSGKGTSLRDSHNVQTLSNDDEPDWRALGRSIALRKLAASSKTRFQLAEAMSAKEVPEDIIDEILDRYVEVGLVDDGAFAEVFVRSRLNERGLARRAIAQELKRRGIADEIAQEALGAIDTEDELAAARQLVEKKMRTTQNIEKAVRYRRIAGALGRKGYSPSMARQVLDEMFAEIDTDDGSLVPNHWRDVED